MVNLIFSGDFAPLTNKADLSEDHFSEVSHLLGGCDLHITNLECPLTASRRSVAKSGPSVRAEPESVELLRQAGAGLVCMANNHIFDYGEEGIDETVQICTENGISVAGIIRGGDPVTASVIKEINGTRIGFLNYCEHEFSVRERGLTGANGYDPADAFNDIRRMRGMTDYVIVVYHGGNEYYPLPRPGLKKDFHFLADAGADAVIGHHTHVISGYEIHNGKPLVYSLGNFFFPYPGEPESWHRGVLCRLTIDETVTMKLVPVIQCRDGSGVVMPSPGEESEIHSEIDRLSAIIMNDAELGKSWSEYARTTGAGLAYRVLYPTRADKLLLKIPFLRRFVSSSERHRSLLNVLRCRSLEQLLIDNIKSRL